MIGKLFLVVEGPSDKHLWDATLRSHCAGAQFKIQVTHGKQKMLRKPAGLVRQANLKGYELTVFILDQDKDPSADDTAQSLKSALGRAGPAVIGVAVRNVESWLLADEEAIRAAFPDSWYTRKGMTDGIARPDVRLSDCVRRHSDGRLGEYRKTRDAPQIAEHFDPKRAQNGSRSLRQFVTALRKAQHKLRS